MTSGIVTLITDFGRGEPYVAAIKGVILGLNSQVRLVDVSHEVAPQDVLEAALLLDQAWTYFPAGSVHLVVVDPGVGTERRRLALLSRGSLFVGPDNGCLSAALPPEARAARRPGEAYSARPTAAPGDVVAVSIENEALMRRPVSATFEGRDVFAPVAAALSRGLPVQDLGPRVDGIVAFPAFRAPRAGESIEGLVVRVDRFGNLITDIRAEDLGPSPAFSVAGRRLEGIASTYARAAGPAAIIGSAGLVEIALLGGSAAQELGVGRGERVTVTSARR